MLKNNDEVWLITFPQFSIYFFLILQISAILCYPGGTYFDNNNLNYSFIRNFLSDLGRDYSFSGENNFLSSQLFNTSLIFAGSVFIIFYYKVSHLFVSYNKVLATISSFFGILGGLSLTIVGLTPSDLSLSLHIMAAHWLFRFFLLASIIYSYLIYNSKILNSKYALGYIIFSISILLYIIISELGPSPKSSPTALTIQVISQKLILLIMIISVYWQTKGIAKLAN